MKSILSILAALLLIAPVTSAQTPSPDSLGEVDQMSIAPAAETCFMCSKSDSKDKCKGFDQCRGDRKHCRSIGCKITGTSSCSTAANVKICSWDGYALETAEEAVEEAELSLDMCML